MVGRRLAAFGQKRPVHMRYDFIRLTYNAGRTILKLFQIWRQFATSAAYILFLGLSFCVGLEMLCVGVFLMPDVFGLSKIPSLQGVGMAFFGICYFLSVALFLVSALLVPVASFIGFFSGNLGPTFISLCIYLVQYHQVGDTTQWAIAPLLILCVLLLSLRWFRNLTKKPLALS